MSETPTLPVAVLFERSRAPNRWEAWGHRLLDVLPDDGRFGAGSQVLRDDGNVRQVAHPGHVVSLHRDEAEGYHLNLTSGAPVWFVMWRVDDEDPSRAWPERVTLSYDEAGRLLDAQERVDNVPLPLEIVDWLRTYVEANYKPEPKRRRRPASFNSPEQR
jgi:hypothetical protein